MPRIPIDKLDCPHAFICWRGDVEQVGVGEVWIEHEHDHDPDLTYLQESAADGYPELLDKWKNDELYYIGVRAAAELRIPYGHTSNGPCFMTHRFSSGGVWGIEVIDGDDEVDYIKEVENEELDGLKDILKMLFVDLSNWDALVKNIDHKQV